MRAQSFEKLVAERANKQVQEKISAFRDAVKKALSALGGKDLYDPCLNPSIRSDGKIALGLASDYETAGWPTILWEQEEELVKNQLLATLDVMQKALIDASAERDPNEAKPIGGRGATGDES